MEEYALTRAAEALNEWNEREKTWRAAGTIRAAVSTLSGSQQTTNELLRISSTHTALTRDEVKPGDRFGGYRVDYVIPGGGRRLNQLFLTREEAAHEGCS